MKHLFLLLFCVLAVFGCSDSESTNDEDTTGVPDTPDPADDLVKVVINDQGVDNGWNPKPEKYNLVKGEDEKVWVITQWEFPDFTESEGEVPIEDIFFEIVNEERGVIVKQEIGFKITQEKITTAHWYKFQGNDMPGEYTVNIYRDQNQIESISFKYLKKNTAFSYLGFQKLLKDRTPNDTIYVSGVIDMRSEMTLDNVNDVIISGKPGLLFHSQPNDLLFQLNNCKNITFHNVYFSHVLIESESHCDNGVFALENCSDISFIDCDISGSGMYGIHSINSTDITVKNTDVHHCVTMGVTGKNSTYYGSDNKFRMNDTEAWRTSDFSMDSLKDYGDQILKAPKVSHLYLVDNTTLNTDAGPVMIEAGEKVKLVDDSYFTLDDLDLFDTAISVSYHGKVGPLKSTLLTRFKAPRSNDADLKGYILQCFPSSEVVELGSNKSTSIRSKTADIQGQGLLWDVATGDKRIISVEIPNIRILDAFIMLKHITTDFYDQMDRPVIGHNKRWSEPLEGAGMDQGFKETISGYDTRVYSIASTNFVENEVSYLGVTRVDSGVRIVWSRYSEH